MNWIGKRVLITGAGGFIGSHLTERLLELGATTRAFVHYNALGSWGWLNQSHLCKELEIVCGDVCDRDSVKQAMNKIEIVFHLAALIGIPYSYHSPTSYIRTNIEGSLNLLQTSRELGIERFIHTSTSEVYGTAHYVPIDEGHPLQGQSPYSASKIGADKMVEAFNLSFKLPVVIIRPFNTFGPRQSARAVIPAIIMQLLAGQVVRLGNLNPKRDMNYVGNTVDGFVLGASTPAAVGRTINLGSGKEVGMGELAELIARLMGKPIRIEGEDARVRPDGSEVERLLADSVLAREMLGWQPRVNLEEGLRRTIDWIRKNPEGYHPGVYSI